VFRSPNRAVHALSFGATWCGNLYHAKQGAVVLLGSCAKDLQGGAPTRGGCSCVMTRLEQRGGVAIAFMAAALWIMLLIAAWEYLF
jgi:hypothetical protein